MIFHLAAEADWERGRPYAPPSLDTEGFVHCSTASQLIGVADALYRGRRDLVLLTVDPGRLSAPVVFEDCYETGERFPHVYGAVDPEAVVEARPLRPGPDGRFGWDAAGPDLTE